MKTTTTEGKQEASQQVMSKQKPVNKEHRQRTISLIFTADNIAEKKNKGRKCIATGLSRNARMQPQKLRPTNEWRRKEAQHLAHKL
jgi:hypothetical protein